MTNKASVKGHQEGFRIIRLSSLLYGHPYSSSALTHIHEQQLHLVLSDPPPNTLPRPEPKGQRAESCPLPAATPPAGIEAQRILEHQAAPPHRVKTGLDHGLWKGSTDL